MLVSRESLSSSELSSSVTELTSPVLALLLELGVGPDEVDKPLLLASASFVPLAFTSRLVTVDGASPPVGVVGSSFGVPARELRVLRIRRSEP